MPYNENGKEELDDAYDRAFELAKSMKTYVQIVEYKYEFADSNLISTMCPPEAP